MGNLTIEMRPETGADREFLARLYRDTRRREVAAWGWPPEQQAIFLDMQFEAQRRNYLQVFPNAEGRIVRIAGEQDAGRILLAEDAAGVHLIDIALLEAYRNRGMGRELLTQLQADCRERGVALRLQVLAANPARRLYLRMGFAEESAEAGSHAMYLRMVWHPAASPEGT